MNLTVALLELFHHHTLQFSFKQVINMLEELNRAPLGYSAERAPLGGGISPPPPLPNSRTRRRSAVGEAANESSR